MQTVQTLHTYCDSSLLSCTLLRPYPRALHMPGSAVCSLSLAHCHWLVSVSQCTHTLAQAHSVQALHMPDSAMCLLHTLAQIHSVHKGYVFAHRLLVRCVLGGVERQQGTLLCGYLYIHTHTHGTCGHGNTQVGQTHALQAALVRLVVKRQVARTHMHLRKLCSLCKRTHARTHAHTQTQTQTHTHTCCSSIHHSTSVSASRVSLRDRQASPSVASRHPPYIG